MWLRSCGRPDQMMPPDERCWISSRGSMQKRKKTAWMRVATSTGQEYNISSIIDSDFELDIAYEKEGQLYMSTFFAMTYGVGFAALTATIVHVALFHGREIMEQSKASFKDNTADIHTKLMRKYKQVPEWWFWLFLIMNVGATIFACEYYNSQLQLPWLGVSLACMIAIVFTLRIGIITSITSQFLPGLNIITEFLLGIGKHKLELVGGMTLMVVPLLLALLRKVLWWMVAMLCE